jgi:hypothetical protein
LLLLLLLIASFNLCIAAGQSPSNASPNESTLAEAKEDRNLFSVRDGYVLECHRGLPDDVNNELYTNYALHAQSYPQPIRSKMQRCVVLRVVVAVRAILIRIRHIETV